MVSFLRTALLFVFMLGAALADVQAADGAADEMARLNVFDHSNDAQARKLLWYKNSKKCKNVEAGKQVKHAVKPPSGTTKSGDRLRLKCAKGYKGTPTATCQSSGAWSVSGRCKKVTCDNARDLPAALGKKGLVVAEYPDSGVTVYNDWWRLDCDFDTYVSGSVHVKCTEKGWHITSTCKKESIEAQTSAATTTTTTARTCDHGELAAAFDKRKLVVAEYPDTGVAPLGEAYRLNCDSGTYVSGVVNVKCTDKGWNIASTCKRE